MQIIKSRELHMLLSLFCRSRAAGKRANKELPSLFCRSSPRQKNNTKSYACILLSKPNQCACNQTGCCFVKNKKWSSTLHGLSTKLHCSREWHLCNRIGFTWWYHKLIICFEYLFFYVCSAGLYLQTELKRRFSRWVGNYSNNYLPKLANVEAMKAWGPRALEFI